MTSEYNHTDEWPNFLAFPELIITLSFYLIFQVWFLTPAKTFSSFLYFLPPPPTLSWLGSIRPPLRTDIPQSYRPVPTQGALEYYWGISKHQNEHQYSQTFHFFMTLLNHLLSGTILQTWVWAILRCMPRFMAPIPHFTVETIFAMQQYGGLELLRKLNEVRSLIFKQKSCCQWCILTWKARN